MYIVSIEAWAQVAILLTCGPGVVIVNCLGQVVFGVDLPAQRRLCPIFRSGVGLPDIHEYSAGWRVVNEPPGFGASQLGIRAKVNDYLGSSVGVELRYTTT